MSRSILIKSLVCIIFIVILSSTFCLPVSRAVGDIFSQGKGFLEAGKDVDKTLNMAELKDTSNYIYDVLLGIAIMVAIIVAMVLGIQFMAASADEKAKVKEAILPFAVGCIVVFGSFTIWKIAVNMGNDAENQVEANYSDIYGDINNDGTISAKDVTTLQLMLQGAQYYITEQTSELTVQRHDINKDGVVNAKDFDINGDGVVDTRDTIIIQKTIKNVNESIVEGKVSGSTTHESSNGSATHESSSGTTHGGGGGSF